MDFLKELLATEKNTVMDDQLDEGRESRIYKDFFGDIVNLPNVDKLIKEHGLSDGHAFLLRANDGNAYEIQIRPAKFAQHFQHERREPNYMDRKKKEKELLHKQWDKRA